MANTFHSVLIIDDKGLSDAAVRQLVTDLGKGFHHSAVIGPDDMTEETAKSRLPGIDMVVVDWHLRGDGDDGKEALAWVDFFTQEGLPAVIYTGHDEVSQVQQLVDAEIEHGTVRVFSKVDPDAAFCEIEKHVLATADLAGRVGLLWKPAVRLAVFDTLRSLKGLSQNSIRLMMRSAGKDSLDLAEAVTELLLEVMSSTLNPNIEGVRDIITALFPEDALQVPEVRPDEEGNEVTSNQYEALTSILGTLMYDGSSKTRTDTGDIIQVGDYFGVVLTPRCDLARCPDDAPVTYVRARRIRDAYGSLTDARKNFVTETWPQPDKRPSVFALYDVPLQNGRTDLVVEFNNVFTVPYNQTSARIARIRSPYLDALVHSFVRFILRYGMPSFPYRKEDSRQLFNGLIQEKLRRIQEH